MSSFRKACRYCGNDIEMSDKEYGVWLPFELNGLHHDCPAKHRRNQY
jgi:hypothetical protein